MTANATTEDRPIALRLAVIEVRGTTTPVRMTRRARMMMTISGLVVHRETKVVTANVDLQTAEVPNPNCNGNQTRETIDLRPRTSIDQKRVMIRRVSDADIIQPPLVMTIDEGELVNTANVQSLSPSLEVRK